MLGHLPPDQWYSSAKGAGHAPTDGAVAESLDQDSRLAGMAKAKKALD